MKTLCGNEKAAWRFLYFSGISYTICEKLVY